MSPRLRDESLGGETETIRGIWTKDRPHLKHRYLVSTTHRYAPKAAEAAPKVRKHNFDRRRSVLRVGPYLAASRHTKPLDRERRPTEAAIVSLSFFQPTRK